MTSPDPTGTPPPRVSHPFMGAGATFTFVALIGILTWVGLARVESQTRVLEIGEEIKILSDQRSQLLQRLRRLKTERAYLRRPERIKEQAHSMLGMVPLDPSRRQKIQLAPKGPARP